MKFQTTIGQNIAFTRQCNRGVCILDVKSPSPGTDAGLREHDVIVAVDGKPVRDIIGFRTVLYDKN